MPRSERDNGARFWITGMAIVVLLMVYLVGESGGLPWEEVSQDLKPQLRLAKRTATNQATRSCPSHPKPVPQSFISRQFLPLNLRKSFNNIDAIVKRSVGASSTSAAVGVVYDRELVWQQGYGLVDPSSPSSNVDANTIFRLGSITKVITTVMLFKLRDEGKIHLDEPIQRYVPELKWKSPFKNNPGITWRSLAGQSSGLTGMTPCNFMTIWELFGDACDITNSEAWKRVIADEPTVPMWQDPHYADSAYAIIGRALESVVGMSYEEYVRDHIWKPLGMHSTYMAYDAWGEMAKRMATGRSGNSSVPSFVAHLDLNWARPTGNVYSTVSDMAKFASLFLVGRGEEQNTLGIYSSSLREMLSPAFINDDQVTAYGFPFEIRHSSSLGENQPDYWLRTKGGMMPGYWSLLILVPEMKAAMIVLANSPTPWAWDAVAALLPAMEQSLWDLQPLPNNPGNLTAYAGTYLASALFGLVEGNVTVVADLSNNQLISHLSLGSGGAQTTSMGVSPTVWDGGNEFVLLRTAGRQCLDLESGITNARMHFSTAQGKVVSLAVAVEPLYGWTFYKQ